MALIRMGLKRALNSAKTESKSIQNTAKTQPKHSQNRAKTQSKHRQNRTKTKKVHKRFGAFDAIFDHFPCVANLAWTGVGWAHDLAKISACSTMQFVLVRIVA